MKGNLMANLKEFFIKTKQEDNTFNLIEYYELVKQNIDKLEEIIIHSELTDYEFQYEVIDGFTCGVGIAFRYECEDSKVIDEIITYNLTFVSYGENNCMNIIKYYNVGNFELLDEDITEDIKMEWEDSLKIFKLQEMKREIAEKREYILLEQKRLEKLEEEMKLLSV